MTTDDLRTREEQCRYMAAAYPILDGYDTCHGFHQHNPNVFLLAFLLACEFQDTRTPTDEQVAWFLNDAQAVIDSHPEPMPHGWDVSPDRVSPIVPGVDFALIINGVEFVVPESEWEPSVPELRSTYLRDRDLTERDLTDD